MDESHFMKLKYNSCHVERWAYLFSKTNVEHHIRQIQQESDIVYSNGLAILYADRRWLLNLDF